MTTIRSEDVARDLPGVLARAAAGESFEVIDTGRPIARIVPARNEAKATEERLKEFEEHTAYIRSMANRYPPNFSIDVSRESIYADREDSSP